ncbi:hypothetical protein OG413_46640 [Streptomyces sp. NBC_01433]|uniref:hypothetical protein n=1 Tax=Streptomyces sp. NBC_01433 TaxID=2903864 RepID=UPI0022592B6F|nr:hypothetical protein [Streptomyces sp. NBC_01433]MCX4682627.1 hypothetical protein [Streptomyces sp. NBC_01433]MCX4682667.1 hypothetical protein [Streptomyces sp. NBC_01433]
MSVIPFVVAVEPWDLEALDEKVSAGRASELAWLKKAREDEGVRFLRGKAQSEARGRVRAKFAAMRAKGKLAGTRDLVVARAVRAELKTQALDGPYEPLPSKDARMPGRRVGTGPSHYDRFGHEKTKLTARMAVRLPADLGEQLVRATYWTSAPAVKALWEWQTRWGDGPEVIFREAERRGAVTLLDVWCAAMASRPDADAIFEKAKLRAQIITTGDIFRAAVKRTIR